MSISSASPLGSLLINILLNHKLDSKGIKDWEDDERGGGGNKLLEGGNYFKHFCLWIFFRAFVFCKVSNYLREAINRGMAVIHGNKLFHLSNPRAWMLKNLNRELRDLVQFLLWWPRYSWLKWNTIFVIYYWFFASCAKTFYTWCSNPQLYIYIFWFTAWRER